MEKELIEKYAQELRDAVNNQIYAGSVSTPELLLQAKMGALDTVLPGLKHIHDLPEDDRATVVELAKEILRLETQSGTY